MFLSQTYNYVLNPENGTIKLSLTKGGVITLAVVTLAPMLIAAAVNAFYEREAEKYATLENVEKSLLSDEK